MKIISWNVNGVRSFPVSVEDILKLVSGDVVCVQETKLSRDALDSSMAFPNNFDSFFSFCRTKRSGYSGVATFCNSSTTPVAAEEGLSGILSPESDIGGLCGVESLELREPLKTLDSEGRAVITSHRIKNSESGTEYILCLFNVYCPRFDPDKPERWQFKMSFYNLLEHRAKALRRENVHVMIVGDLNVSCCRIDHCDPDADLEFDTREHRLWINEFLWDSFKNPDGMFIDLFRYL